MEMDYEPFLFDGSEDLLSSLSLPSVLERDASPEEILAEATKSFTTSSENSHSSSSDEEYKCNTIKMESISRSPKSNIYIKPDNMVWNDEESQLQTRDLSYPSMHVQDSICLIKKEIKMEEQSPYLQGGIVQGHLSPSAHLSRMSQESGVVAGRSSAPITPPASPPSILLLSPPNNLVTPATPVDNKPLAVIPSAGRQPSKVKQILLSRQEFVALSKKMCNSNSSVVKTSKPSLVACVATSCLQPSTTMHLIHPLPPASSHKTITVQKPESLKVKPIVAAPLKPNTNTSSSAEEVFTPLELRALKKHQRMIKNRESACLSRKKKKEYVSMLENRLAIAEAEINQLKAENMELRAQLRLSSSADMGASNIINRNKVILPSLKTAAGILNGTGIHKKNVALLFAMMLMVSLNIGGFGTYWLRGESATLASKLSRAPHHTRTLLWAAEQDSQEQNSDYLDVSNATKCPSVNSSESERISSALHKWAFTNLSTGPHRDDFIPQDTPYVLDYDSRYTKWKKMYKYQKTKLRSANKKSKKRAKLTSGALQAEVRWPETYYLVVSRLMLPPLTLNHTHPPKVALILPHPNHNESTSEEFFNVLQVDCAVLDTNLLKLRVDSIPDYLMNLVLPLNSKDRIQKKEGKNKQNLNVKNPRRVFKSRSSGDVEWNLSKIHPSIINIKRANNYTMTEKRGKEPLPDKQMYNETLQPQRNNHFALFLKPSESSTQSNSPSKINNILETYNKLEGKWRENFPPYTYQVPPQRLLKRT